MQCLPFYQLPDFKLTKKMILHLLIAKIVIKRHQKTQVTNSFEMLLKMYVEN